ncbi:uncharacterized protein LACBIDRAFT_295380 [Laccaria bicolor S238N-H82]|uniref:Predicted protein n=1 Tax=Laccaria bicolor (strain S238N-H82 / ATCC MYA-4686) TaxID=486041 RepID=B0DRL8_LACBS|nr:uncharacterized protein LACBIDRAFT_295380 [Laccaria bicolor S238N-H82]EDR02894.1 predicted protein [Laccaria bicolor S238N-H82]|eukprot:XP_001886604.1 predicted protein [Laccaria bicolor S238N-H82]
MLGVFSTLLLAFAPSYAAAAICSPGFNWTYNSQGQSPCDIAASLLGVCAPGAGDILYLSPLIQTITPLCQVPFLNFPQDIIMLGQQSNPGMNVVAHKRQFTMPLESHLSAAGGAESVAGPSATTTGLGVSPTNMQSPKKKPNSGAIAGGVVGGVALLVIMAIVVVWFVLRRRDSRRQSRFSYASSVKTEPQGYTG